MFKKYALSALPHLTALLLFIGTASMYFSPVFKGFGLNQGDINQFMGMSKEIADFRLVYGEEPLWTNSMFGGMPAYQISVIHAANWMLKADHLIKLGLPGPVGILFMAMLGFYILGLCMRINPWLAIIGAIGFGLAGINILFLGAGHNGKVNAIVYMAPALGGLLMAYRFRRIAGAAIFTLFFALQVSANHLQMTYYLVLLLVAVAIGEGVAAVMRRSFKPFLLTSIWLAGAGVVAILPSASNLMTTYEYGKYTTRGTSELTIHPDGTARDLTDVSGLESSYILDYNFAKGEIWSLMIPDAKGGRSGYLGNEKDALKSVPEEYRENVGKRNRYWGDQRGTGGAFYFGAAIMLLMLFGFFFSRDSIRWVFLIMTALALSLCLKSESGLNSFFISHFPLYNKFRDSKMILVLVQLMAPLLAVIALDGVLKQKESISRKWFLIFSGVMVVLLLIFSITPRSFFDFQSAAEKDQLAQYMDQIKPGSEDESMVTDFIANLETVRETIFRSDVQRTLMVVIIVLAIVALFIYNVLNKYVVIPLLILIVGADQWTVDRRYLGNDKIKVQEDNKTKMVYEHYVKMEDKLFPHLPSMADSFILEAEKKDAPAFAEIKAKVLSGMKSSSAMANVKDEELIDQIADFGALGLTTDYRVLSLGDPFNDAGTSYFHKSLGGYHGAKLKRYQELIEFYVAPEMKQMVDSLQNQRADVFEILPVLNMLNMRYILYNADRPPLKNNLACGNAWFVNEVKLAADANDEMKILGTINTHNVAVADQRFKDQLIQKVDLDSTASIVLEEYRTNYLRYKTNNSVEATGVFSEIYYPEGWHCTVDGKEVPYSRVNYLLRGLTIPAGDHVVEWTFSPESFIKGSKISLAGSIAVLLLALAALWAEWRNRRRSQPAV